MNGLNSSGCAFPSPLNTRNASGSLTVGGPPNSYEGYLFSAKLLVYVFTKLGCHLFKRCHPSYDVKKQNVLQSNGRQDCKNQAMEMPLNKDRFFTCSSILRVKGLNDNKDIPSLRKLLTVPLRRYSVKVAPVDAGVCKNTIDTSSVTVVTAYDEGNENYARLMLEHQTSALEEFSSFFAFSQVLNDLSVKRHPTWAKVPAMYQVINDKLVAGEGSHWVVWIDSDVFFYNGNGNASELILRLINEHGNDPNIHYIFTTDPTPEISAINNGVFAMRVSETSLNFLDLAWRQSQFSNKGEGACGDYCLDEQDAMTVVLTSASSEIRAAAKIVSAITGVNKIFRFPTVKSGENYINDDPESEFQGGTGSAVVQIGCGMAEHRERIVKYFLQECQSSVCSRREIISALRAEFNEAKISSPPAVFNASNCANKF